MSGLRILGASDAAIAMLVEAWDAARGLGSVIVVQNIAVASTMVCVAPHISMRRVQHENTDAWLECDFPTVLGAYRPAVKEQVQRFFAQNYDLAEEAYARTVSGSAELASSVVLGPGAWLGPGAVVAPFTSLDAFVTVNRGALIGHHVQIDAFATLGPGTIIGGRTRIGAGVSIGLGAKVFDGIEIGANAVIGAGALVTRSVSAGMLAYGVPAKAVRRADDGLPIDG